MSTAPLSEDEQRTIDSLKEVFANAFGSLDGDDPANAQSLIPESAPVLKSNRIRINPSRLSWLSCYRASAVGCDGCTRRGDGGDCVGAWQGVQGSVSVGVAVHGTCAAEGHVRL